MHINVKFTYRNVGQGLFYTGTIGSFNFVYDCGSENRRRLSQAASRYKRELHGNLDLLIISHFHYDHILGLEELLKDKDISVDTVILPYLKPVERLIISLQRLDLPLWYYEFLSDPVSFLVEKGVRKIIIIGGTEGEEGGSAPEGFPLNNKPENTGINWEKMKDDKELKKQIIKEYDPKWNNFMNERRLLFVKNHYGYATALNGFWVFKFFNYKLEEQKLFEFKECLKQNRLLLFSEYSESLREIMKDRNQLSKLRDCYKILSRYLNHTSLVVYHGPISDYRSNVECVCRSAYFPPPICFFSNSHFIKRRNEIGQLLTGDIKLTSRWEDINNHFDAFRNNISVVQVPHHGARRNWNRNLLETIKNPSFWVISAGISNKYGHPHIDVLDDIINNENCLCWSNELNEVNIEGSITWY